jgi:hypothetical protein
LRLRDATVGVASIICSDASNTVSLGMSNACQSYGKPLRPVLASVSTTCDEEGVDIA